MRFRIPVLAAAVCASPSANAGVKIDSNAFGGMQARALGPAVMKTDPERVNSQLKKRELETLRPTSFEEWQEDKTGR